MFPLLKIQVANQVMSDENPQAAPTFLWLADPWDDVDEKLDWIAQVKNGNAFNLLSSI